MLTMLNVFTNNNQCNKTTALFKDTTADYKQRFIKSVEMKRLCIGLSYFFLQTQNLNLEDNFSVQSVNRQIAAVNFIASKTTPEGKRQHLSARFSALRRG